MEREKRKEVIEQLRQNAEMLRKANDDKTIRKKIAVLYWLQFGVVILFGVLVIIGVNQEILESWTVWNGIMFGFFASAIWEMRSTQKAWEELDFWRKEVADGLDREIRLIKLVESMFSDRRKEKRKLQ